MISLGRVMLLLGAVEAALAGVTGTRTLEQGDFTPRQPGIVANCTKFYKVRPGDNCYKIAQEQDISADDFAKWNSKVGPHCEFLLAGYYACVSVTEPTKPTPGTPIQTPAPVQPGMVANCNRFYTVKPGQACFDVERETGVRFEDLVRWNPAIGKDCSNMWAHFNVCVGVAK